MESHLVESRLMEKERKFLVRNLSYREDAFDHSRIVQGYLCCDPARTVRVRIRGDRGYITVKGIGSPDGVSRFEWEKEIPSGEAEALLQLALPGVIEKVRYLVRNSDGKHVWEVDEFHGANEGLVLAEIELLSSEETFDRPSWLGDEVTGDARYYNSSLSRRPLAFPDTL